MQEICKNQNMQNLCKKNPKHDEISLAENQDRTILR